MSEVNPRDFRLCDPETGNGYVMPDDIKRAIGSGGSPGIPKGREPWIAATKHYTAYVVKAGAKERYAKNQRKSLAICIRDARL